MDQILFGSWLDAITFGPIGRVERYEDETGLWFGKRVDTREYVIIQTEGESYMVYRKLGNGRWMNAGNGKLFEEHFPDQYMEWIL